MKLLVIVCLVAAAVAAPADVQLIRYNYDNSGVGGFSYGFEQSDGTKHDSRGELRNEGQKDESLVITGSFGWRGPDGVFYLVKYVADENGYHPEIEQGPGSGGIPSAVASLLG